MFYTMAEKTVTDSDLISRAMNGEEKCRKKYIDAIFTLRGGERYYLIDNEEAPYGIIPCWKFFDAPDESKLAVKYNEAFLDYIQRVSYEERRRYFENNPLPKYNYDQYRKYVG